MKTEAEVLAAQTLVIAQTLVAGGVLMAMLLLFYATWEMGLAFGRAHAKGKVKDGVASAVMGVWVLCSAFVPAGLLVAAKRSAWQGFTAPDNLYVIALLVVLLVTTMSQGIALYLFMRAMKKAEAA